jgi:DNA-binding protein HU-beta
MNETELITGLSLQLDWKEQDVEVMLSALGNVTSEMLGDRNIVCLDGFGQLEAKKIDEQTKFDPADGKTYLIPPKLVATYEPASSIKAYLKTLDRHE